MRAPLRVLLGPVGLLLVGCPNDTVSSDQDAAISSGDAAHLVDASGPTDTGARDTGGQDLAPQDAGVRDGSAVDRRPTDVATGSDATAADRALSGGWEPPIGVPWPDFVVDDGHESACPGCSTITQSDLGGLDGIAAGTVVEISGGPFTGGTLRIRAQGTATQPVFVRSAPGAQVVIRRNVEIEGSYLVVEDIDFDLSSSSEGVGVSGDHITIRHSAVHGFRPGHNSTALYLSGAEQIVIYDCDIHDNGSFEIAGELDVHGVGAGNTHQVWIVDSRLHHNRGDSIQFGHRAANTLGDFYVGRNDIHGDGENCVDVKEASNVVVTENTLHEPASGYPAVVFHDCPLNAALIYNQVRDTAVGVSLGSLEDACDDHQPVSIFIARNNFVDISGTGIEGWGSGKRHLIAGNDFAGVGTPIDVDPVSGDSIVSEGDDRLDEVFSAYLAAYGIDISAP